jgi:transcription initiation factor TFIIIB Brf1 subunit/transcription initiation factor TFIIB
MDLISFILGMSIVVVIAVAVVAVMAFVRVNKANKEIATIHNIMGNEFDRVHREREREITDVYRTLDSRLDKLESKLTDTIKNGCDPVKK